MEVIYLSHVHEYDRILNLMAEAIADIFKGLWDVWMEIFSVIFSAIPKIVSFTLWAVFGVFILPCVYIARNIFPKWVEWGEDF